MKSGPKPAPREVRRANRVNLFVGDMVYEGLRAECVDARDMNEFISAAVTVYITMPPRERAARLSAVAFNLRANSVK